jgi:two-component system, chemotaxis family, chemotaxis protein CheY
VKGAKQVLVVEDDDTILCALEIMLSENGYDVRTAPHGRAALDAITVQTPDVILLDMRMPVMDGWEFAEAYRQTPGPHAPIIVLTAATDPPGCAEQIHAADNLPKPFEMADLLSSVARHAV